MSLVLFTKGNINKPSKKYKKLANGGYDPDKFKNMELDDAMSIRTEQNTPTVTKPSTASLYNYNINTPEGLKKPTQSQSASKKGGFDVSSLSSVLSDAAPYVSNIANMFRKVPKPATPELEGAISPNLVNYSADKAELDRTQASFARGFEANSPNAVSANASKVASLASFLEAKGKLTGAERNTNASIKNQIAGVNSGIRARNTGRVNQYKDDVVNSQIAQQQFNQENLADFATKYGSQSRDKKLMSQEDRKISLLPSLYKDTGVGSRNGISEALLSELYSKGMVDAQGNLIKKKMGGRLKRKIC